MVPSASRRPRHLPFVRLAAHPLRWKLLTALADSDLRVRELVERVGEPQNLVSYHLRLLRDGGLVTATRSSFDGRDSYYHLDLDALRRCAGRDRRRLAPGAAARRCRMLRTTQAIDHGAAPPCCSCAPVTASAHRWLRRCCATTPPTA